MSTPPHWDLSNVYPSLESREFETAIATVKGHIDGLEKLFAENVARMNAKTPVKELAGVVGDAIDRFNALYETAGTVRAYLQSFVATDSHNTLAMKKMSEFQMVGVRMQNLGNQFQAWVGKLSPVLEKVIQANPIAQAHAFSLRDYRRAKQVHDVGGGGSPGSRTLPERRQRLGQAPGDRHLAVDRGF